MVVKNLKIVSICWLLLSQSTLALFFNPKIISPRLSKQGRALIVSLKPNQLSGSKLASIPSRVLFKSFTESFWFGFILGALFSIGKRSFFKKSSNQLIYRNLLSLRKKMLVHFGSDLLPIKSSRALSSHLEKIKRSLRLKPTFLKGKEVNVIHNHLVKKILNKSKRKLKEIDGTQLVGFMLGFFVGSTFVNTTETLAARIDSNNREINRISGRKSLSARKRIRHNRKGKQITAIHQMKSFKRPFFMLAKMGDFYHKYHEKLDLADLHKELSGFLGDNRGQFKLANRMIHKLLA